MSDLSELIKFVDQHGDPITIDVKQDGGIVGWVTPGRRTRFKIRPRGVAGLRIERITIDKPEGWWINDIRMQNRSQLSPYHISDRCEDDGVPAAVFGAPGIDTHNRLTFETWQTAMDIVFDVIYKGANPEGQPFGMVVYCTAAR